MKRHAPTAAVIFTDLEVSIPPNPGIPIIWVCVENLGKKVPYGRLVHFSEKGRAEYRMTRVNTARDISCSNEP